MIAKRAIHVLAFVALTACDGNETFTDRAEGIPLMLEMFQSYATEQQVRSSLGSVVVEEVERSSLPAGDSRPPFNIVTLRVPLFAHLDDTGPVHLTFFNDRLQTVAFYPADLQKYLSAVRQRGIDVTTGVTPTPHLHVWVTRDYLGREYVGWADRRLEDQSYRWISRYSYLDRRWRGGCLYTAAHEMHGISCDVVDRPHHG